MMLPNSFLLAMLCAYVVGAQNECITNVEQLEESFKMNLNNVNEITKAFLPKDKATTPHIVLVHYCVLDEKSSDIKNATCNDTSVDFNFQWLDYALFTALTFDFAKLTIGKVHLVVGSFCKDLPKEYNEVYLLGILTSELKSIAAESSKDENKGYALYIKGKGKVTIDKKETRLKYVIGVWLFVAAITFAGILHCGRCSKTMSKKLEEMIEDFVAFPVLIVNTFNILDKLSKLIKVLKELSDDKNKSSKKDKEETKKQRDDKSTQTEDDTLDHESTDEDLESKISEAIIRGVSGRKHHKKKFGKPTAAEQNTDNLNIHSPFPFLKWFEQAQMFYPLCVIYFIVFICVDTYFLIKTGKERSNRYEFLYDSPIPIWFVVILIFNLICLCITNCFKLLNEGRIHSSCVNLACRFVIVISVTTLPLFLFFHGFWLFIAAVAYPAQVATSAVFYTPVLSVSILYSVTLCDTFYIFIKCCHEYDSNSWNTLFISLAPIIFLPFWGFFLASLYIISDFALRFVKVSKHPWRVILVSLAVIASAHKLAKLCVAKPNSKEHSPSLEN